MRIFKIEDFDNEYFNKNLVIDASAGTGKTYTITQIVKKLVDNNDENKRIDIKKVLIVTYTDKATGELRDRIRKELNHSRNVDKNDLDNLNIYTIHSFCQNSIKEFGLKANQPLNLDVIDEPTMVDDFFEKYVRTNKELLDTIDKIISNEFKFEIIDRNKNSNDIKKYFVQALLKYYLKINGDVDKDIISIEPIDNMNLFDYLISTNPFESLYNGYNDFKDNYDKLKESNIYELNFLAEEIKRCINNHDFKLGNTFKFNLDEWNISNEEREAINFFSTNEETFKYSNNIEDYDISTDLGKYYNILKNSDFLLCKIFIEKIKKNNTNKTSFKIKCPKVFTMPNPEDLNNPELVEAHKYFVKLFEELRKINCYEVLLNRYINDFYMKWQEEKRKNKNQTFNDMLRTIRETLLNEEAPYPFKTALQNKYTYAIIDEFQDTNQLQFDTFKKIFMEDDNHHIIVVGDPKQSIYSFQGADLNVYQKAKEEIINNGGIATTLKTNYRSSKAMIEECNKFFADNLFKKAMDPSLGENIEDSNENDDDNIEFVESDSQENNMRKAKLDGNEIEPFIMGIDKEDENDYISETKYAKLVVNKIIEFCKKENGRTKLQLEGRTNPNVTFKDFTILARARSETVYIERELRKCGIPFIKYKDKGLFSSNECYHWVAILEAINTTDFTGYKRKKLKKALFTDFFNRTLEEINSNYFEHDDCSEIKLINKWKLIAKENKWEDLFDDIIFESNLLSNLKTLDKLQSLTIYKQISNYCVSYLYDNHSLDDLIYKLKHSSKDSDDDENSGTVEIGTDFDAVKIMTIHASKGLQYPIVISVAGFRAPNKNGNVVYTFHDKNDSNKRKIGFDSNSAEKDMEQEWKRLLYVCYTRAEYINIIPYYPLDDKNLYSKILHDANTKYLENVDKKCLEIRYDRNSINYNNLREAVRNIIASNEEALNIIDTKADRDELRKKEGGLKSYKNSYSSLSHPKDKTDENQEEVLDEERDKEDSPSDEFDLSEFDLNSKQINTKLDSKQEYAPYDKFPRGATIGTALHEVFENIDFTNPNANLASVIEERLKANRIKITDEIKNYISNLVDNVLNANLPEINGNEEKETFKLSEINNDNKKPEIEFNFNLKNGRLKNYCNGFIDLLFKRGEYYSILDWKSDTLNDDFISYSDNDSLKKHTDKHYSIQRVLYSYCLIQWLKDMYNETPDDIFKNHFGGIYYVYIRGCNKNTGNGIYSQTWNSYKDLEDAFNNIIKQKVRG